jgi:predicted small lipoprotein YifL
MTSSAMRNRIFLLLLACAPLIFGCGLNGDLYLPPEEPASEQPESVPAEELEDKESEGTD